MVDQEYEAKLKDMSTFLKGNTNLGVQISAFSSADGNARYNLELSNKRAQAVLQFFC